MEEAVTVRIPIHADAICIDGDAGTSKASTLRSGDADLVPEGPADAGAGTPNVDASHLEGAHLLAEDVRVRLHARGFTDEQILDWAKAFLRSERSGGDAEFLAWIKKKEQAAKKAGCVSSGSAAPEHRQPIQKAH
jgi:hypothetical protein